MLGRTEINTLLADNAANDITAAELRQVTTALQGKARTTDYPPLEVDADDVYWDGSQISSDFTLVAPTGSQTITEVEDILSVQFINQATGDWTCVLKPHTWSVGDFFAVPVRVLVRALDSSIDVHVGIIATDGTNTTSACCGVGIGVLNMTPNFCRRAGTITEANSGSFVNMAMAPAGSLWVGIELESAGNLRPHISLDGVSWDPFTASDSTHVATPTHIGLCWATPGFNVMHTASFGPLIKIA